MSGKSIGDIRASDLLGEAKPNKPMTVGRETLLGEVADLMASKSYSRKVYVLDGEGVLVGTITLEAMLKHTGYQLGVREVGIGSFIKMIKDLSKEKASQVMIAPVKVIADETLVNIARLMIENHLNDLPVVDSNGRLVAELDGLEIIRFMRRHFP